MTNTPLTIAVLCSGGDAPGMNAAIRAIVISANNNGHHVIGYLHGYNGLINQESIPLNFHTVHNIIQLGGTILKSARCPQMQTDLGIEKAILSLENNKVDALVVIGGDGSMHGMMLLSQHWNGQLIGLPGTIDNDIAFTDLTIGFTTAINTALDAIDKIRDTADAFDRIFIIELMGKHSGHISFNVGLASAAEKVLSFENFNITSPEKTLQNLAEHIHDHQKNCPGSFIICIAENLWPNGTNTLIEQLKTLYTIDATLCILGHIQRGGSPCAQDRVLATKLGHSTIKAIEDNKSNVMVGEISNEVIITPLEKVLNTIKPISKTILETYQNIHKTISIADNTKK